jgi:glycine betaine/proline transport system substrate-binding protein
MARADWDTGWFQAEVFKQFLEELGYTVKGPVTMNSWDFYPSAARGEIDMWVNGWFPSNYFEEAEIRDKVRSKPEHFRAISWIRNQLIPLELPT